MRENFILRKLVDIRAYVVNLPLYDFKFARIIIDKAQCLQNMES